MFFRCAHRVFTRRGIAPIRLIPCRHYSLFCFNARYLNARHLIGPRCNRLMSTPAPQVNESAISMERYQELSDKTMDTLLERLEELLDDLGNPYYEVEYHSGVLTLSLGDKGTYVINKQPPNKQIWLSSPFSGPKRYDYSEKEDNWLYSRDGNSMEALLNNELGVAFERKMNLALSGLANQS